MNQVLTAQTFVSLIIHVTIHAMCQQPLTITIESLLALVEESCQSSTHTLLRIEQRSLQCEFRESPIVISQDRTFLALGGEGQSSHHSHPNTVESLLTSHCPQNRPTQPVTLPSTHSHPTQQSSTEWHSHFHNNHSLFIPL
ncbi:hypothetical protein BLNAU_22266 [Blattamonas nauphoetae]|uniref:Uncharacterized protein n=1 Tax=Blattamonas nauphoetae TaxID=2049346 RepID=A0ABQ9WTI1_9EUKA|nr:hypothetical protein BLNAU_22266 [Blattamonas nauphoetae]